MFLLNLSRPHFQYLTYYTPIINRSIFGIFVDILQIVSNGHSLYFNPDHIDRDHVLISQRECMVPITATTPNFTSICLSSSSISSSLDFLKSQLIDKRLSFDSLFIQVSGQASITIYSTDDVFTLHLDSPVPDYFSRRPFSPKFSSLLFPNNYPSCLSSPLLIAEIGGNHEGNFEKASILTELAISSSADVVKHQIYSGDSLVNKVISPDRNKHFKRFQLSIPEHRRLANRCHHSNVKYMASVWDKPSIALTNDFVDIFKIGSGDFTCFDIINEVLSTSKPIVLSCGCCDFDEVIQTIKFIYYNKPQSYSMDLVTILQCTVMYPIPPQDANLQVISSIRSYTGLSVGYSDHTEGLDALLLASALNCSMLEFHFTDTRSNQTFRDHLVSLTVDEVHKLRAKIDNFISILGNPRKTLQSSEIENNHPFSFRKAVYLNQDLPKGTIISSEHLIDLRPNSGIDSRDRSSLIGKALNRDVLRYESLDWDIFC